MNDLKSDENDFWLDLTDDHKTEIEISRKQILEGDTEDWESIFDRVSMFES